jgi:hypothetical protein
MPLTQVHNSLLGQPVNHNILINPSFTVFQRLVTTLSGDWGVDHNDTSYGPDRWVVRGKSDVGGDKVQSSTDSSSGINKLVVEHDGAINESYVHQGVEVVNLLGLYGKEMTFSFSYSDVGGSGIPKARIFSWDSSGTQKKLLETVPTSLGNNRWSCTFILSTTDGTIPDPIGKGIQVTIDANEMNTAPNKWSVWETKLEVGSVATPFVARPYSEELALCQRYFYRHWKTQENESIGNASMFSASETYVTYHWPVQMRSSPSVSASAASDFSIAGNGSDFPATNFGAGHPSPFSSQLNFQRLTGLTNGYAYWVRMKGGGASNSKYIQAEAEL